MQRGAYRRLAVVGVCVGVQKAVCARVGHPAVVGSCVGVQQAKGACVGRPAVVGACVGV